MPLSHMLTRILEYVHPTTHNTAPWLVRATVASPHTASWLARRAWDGTNLGSSGTVVTYNPGQTLAIQIVATSMASISIVASITALYWFCLMRRNYRRDLVLLLILSDLLKNFCFILFAGVNFNAGTVQSEDAFCQANGYMLQTGLEACDCAIFFISLHMLLQIFPRPNTVFGYDGLYNVRHWVYFLWFTLPNISAGLAFINDTGAYALQATWCWLPVRPFWYRLALAWIPRYIISCMIMGFAIAIYLHVGSEFKLFGRERHGSTGSDLTTPQSTRHDETAEESVLQSVGSPLSHVSRNSASRLGSIMGDNNAILLTREMSVSSTHGPLASSEPRRHSLPTWTSPFEASASMEAGHRRGSQSAGPSRRGSRQVTFDDFDHIYGPSEPLSPLSPRGQPPWPRTRPSVISYVSSGTPSVPQDSSGTPMPALAEDDNATASLGRSAEVAMKARNQSIRRQVRGLFVYPVAYIVFWIMPFVWHSMNYSAYWAARPLFPVVLLAAASLTSLGLADVILFCWRERPWRHIPGADGTFLGSFCFWRFGRPANQLHRLSVVSGTAAVDEKHQGHGITSEVLRFVKSLLPWRRLFSSAGIHGYGSGGSDRKVREYESAQARLEMERREMREQQAAAEALKQAPSTHAASVETSGSNKSPGTRNWFDQDLHIDT